MVVVLGVENLGGEHSVEDIDNISNGGRDFYYTRQEIKKLLMEEGRLIEIF